jgi:hypothetical protein
MTGLKVHGVVKILGFSETTPFQKVPMGDQQIPLSGDLEIPVI